MRFPAISQRMKKHLTFPDNLARMYIRFRSYEKAVKVYSRHLSSIREGRPLAESLPGFR